MPAWLSNRKVQNDLSLWFCSNADARNRSGKPFNGLKWAKVLMAYPKTSTEAVVAFRERHGGLTQEDVDRLFGFSSKGRACRRWEEEGVGAPYYVTVLMAYADKYGLDLMRELADKFGSEAT